MRKEIPKLEQPLNANERFLNALAIRLDRMIELLEEKEITKPDVVEVKEVVVTSEETPKPKKTRKK